jgi:hypothetical protein
MGNLTVAGESAASDELEELLRLNASETGPEDDEEEEEEEPGGMPH